MIKKLIKNISEKFRDDDSESISAPLVSADEKIIFYPSNRKIFNTFFNVIAISTFITTIAIILYYVYAYAALYNGDNSFDWLLGIFSDFVVIMNFSLEESPYIVGDSSYPPIAIAILYPFALICKDVFALYRFSELTADELTAEIILHPQFWVAILLFFAICSILIVLLTSYMFGIKGKDRLKLAVIIMLSSPFVYAVMRGNTIYFALIFLVAFLALKNSKNPIARELSYIFLAIAGAIKIYPLFFGVFLLKDKKILASFRVAVYFILISYLSFFMFDSGLDHFSPFIENLGGFMSSENRLLEANNLSISAQIFKLLHLFIPRLSAESTVYSVINLCILFLIFAISTVAAIAAKNDFSRYVICFAIVLLIPSISYFYVIIFAILPFLEYIRYYSCINIKKRIFYFLSFMFLFTTLFVLSKNFILHSFIIIAMLTVEIVSVFLQYKKKKS